ncbi:type I-E CRISPR-associated protein Cse2/CasB [Gordonia sihwensis]|uniref:Putative CRISPR-associated protein n=1 Tax=Gordonia sihwensis NBRC 108236 TaxID=1223544 RepID=L7LLN0_9ACTN|nr:type I-E CRISPR-associated protein Cse2/CasB [Gordonia sihwensis]MBY4570214.1 type I-E CRISPR-associated protein Cse2/CasB [Gordonia sihwensis]WFN93909.1 type I-E CRISPR-associated protein Cse2/CasB [Gordonia sihwensis]GAC61794.1 putative CRISPR-associated protein [Gordonia sihwensis NBRC 108236]
MTDGTEARERYGINRHVAKRAADLYAGARRNSGPAVAAFAKLRRAATSQIGEDPAAWQVAFLGYPTPDGDFPFPTFDEQAVYDALRLYALHQQSKNEPMHVDGPSFGTALSRLAHTESSDGPSEPVLKRFNALVTADSPEETRWHLRSLVGQLRAHGIPLDYGRFADDLAALAGKQRKGTAPGESRRRVQLQWSRDFSRTPQTTAESV